MNRITDLSTKDLLKLSDDDIERYIQIELMHEGIVVPPLPQKPNQFALAKTVKVWRIQSGGITLCTFPTQEIAQAVLTAGQGQFMTEDYIYSVGYDKKFMVCRDNCVIIAEDTYDEQDLRRYEKQLAQAKTAQEDYEDAMRVYNDASIKSIDLHSRVLDAVNKARRSHAKAVQLANTFNKYTILANGDRQTAVNFLLQICSQEDIDEANELLPDDDKIPAACK